MAIQTDPLSGQYTCGVGEREGHINGPVVRAEACQATGDTEYRGTENGKMGDMGRQDPNLTLGIKGVGHKEIINQNDFYRKIYEKSY